MVNLSLDVSNRIAILSSGIKDCSVIQTNDPTILCIIEVHIPATKGHNSKHIRKQG